METCVSKDYSDMHVQKSTYANDTTDHVDRTDQVVSAMSLLAAVGRNDDAGFINVKHCRHKPAVTHTKVSPVPSSKRATLISSGSWQGGISRLPLSNCTCPRRRSEAATHSSRHYVALEWLPYQ